MSAVRAEPNPQQSQSQKGRRCANLLPLALGIFWETSVMTLNEVDLRKDMTEIYEIMNCVEKV